MKRVMVWDPWVRLFHWILVGAMAVSFYTMKTEGYPLLFPIDWHARAGYVVLGLILFRWCWGLIGSRHARFTSFLRGPRQLWSYGKRFITGGLPEYAGHNPLGGWVVLVMLLSLTLQGVSGLFLHDDILFEAPLYGTVGKSTTGNLATLHVYNGNFLLILVGLHLVALVVHRIKGERLVGAMFTGRKRFEGEPVDGGGEIVKLMTGLWLALIPLALATVLVVWLWNS
ncbi:cytochrome b/b6 domain-containing protein [Pistricoccus aurantiacus]|uniref:cytochrome b/b6 domain-containing protein n=1 Tax=Pistricoccus aurantiacus TaxID=1883414 RepID=UPI00362EAE98